MSGMSGECDGWAVRSLLRPGAVLVVLLLVLLLVLAASWCRRYARFRRLELAMPGPRSLPFIGSALKLININEDNSLDTVMGLWGDRFSELSRFSIFNHLFVFVTDPDHIDKVLRGRPFSEKSVFFYYHLKDMLGEGLVTSDGAHWKRHRTLMQPAFTVEILNGLFDIVLEEADKLVDRLRPLAGKDTEYTLLLYHCFADPMLRSKVCKGTKTDKEDFELMVTTIPKILRSVCVRALRPWLWPSAVFYRTAAGRQQIKFSKLVTAVVGRTHDEMTAFKEKRFSRTDIRHEVDPKDRKSFVDTLCETELSKEDLVDEIKTIGGAAIETSSTTLSFALKLLSMYPDIQRVLFDEICDALEGSDRLLSAADLSRMPYMDRVLKEVLRIFPPVPILGRKVREETQLAGKTLPANSSLLINIFGLHRDPRHYPDPLQFDPDRFLPEKVADRHPHCFLPFSAGPRNCIGKQLAMMQMKTVLATLLRAYSVHPANDGITHPSQIPVTVSVTLSMVGSVKIRFESRSVKL